MQLLHLLAGGSIVAAHAALVSFYDWSMSVIGAIFSILGAFGIWKHATCGGADA